MEFEDVHSVEVLAIELRIVISSTIRARRNCRVATTSLLQEGLNSRRWGNNPLQLIIRLMKRRDWASVEKSVGA